MVEPVENLSHRGNRAQNERGDDGTIGDNSLQELGESELPDRPPAYT